MPQQTRSRGGARRPPRLRPRRSRAIRSQRLLGAVALAGPAVALVLAFYLYPLVQNVVMSLQAFTTATFFTGEAPWVGVDNYAAVIGDGGFWPAVRNTVVFTVASIVFQFGIGLAIALHFHRRFPLSGALRGLLLLPWLIPLLAGSAVWRGMLDRDAGIVNVTLGLLGLEPIGWLSDPDVALVSVVIVNIWIGIPFNAILLYGGLQDIPRDHYEAAALDGAGRRQQLRFITLPALRPVVSVVVILGVVYTLKVVDVILALTGGGPAGATQTIAVRAYRTSFELFDFGAGAALNTVLVVVALLFAVLYLRADRRTGDA